jgi:hypothetical protein
MRRVSCLFGIYACIFSYHVDTHSATLYVYYDFILLTLYESRDCGTELRDHVTQREQNRSWLNHSCFRKIT